MKPPSRRTTYGRLILLRSQGPIHADLRTALSEALEFNSFICKNAQKRPAGWGCNSPQNIADTSMARYGFRRNIPRIADLSPVAVPERASKGTVGTSDIAVDMESGIWLWGQSRRKA